MAHRALHVLTRSFPTRRSSELPLPITRPRSGGWAAKSSECIINSNAYRPRLGISCGGAHADESRGQINVIAFDIVFEIGDIGGEAQPDVIEAIGRDRKSTRLNSSH